jgi:hypothetical protein
MRIALSCNLKSAKWHFALAGLKYWLNNPIQERRCGLSNCHADYENTTIESSLARHAVGVADCVCVGSGSRQ